MEPAGLEPSGEDSGKNVIGNYLKLQNVYRERYLNEKK